MIAEANGLGAGSTLTPGQAITIPAKLANGHNTSDTFRPYDAARAIGDTQPTTPKPPKKPKCGVFGQILRAIITIVVAEAVPIGGVLGAMAVSTASQGISIALGLQDKFSFKQVALAGITAGVDFFNPLRGVPVVGAALTNAVTQGIAVATGLQKKFDWAGVAAAGVIDGVAGLVSRNLPGKATYNANGSLAQPASFANRAVSNMAGAIAGAATRSAISGTSFGDNLIAVLPDVIGNTIGNMIANGVARGGSARGGNDDINSDLVKYSAEERAAMLPTPVQTIDVPASVSSELALAVPAEAADFPPFSNPIRDAFEGLFRDAEVGRRDLIQRISNLPADAANALADSMRGSEARNITTGENERLTCIFGNKLDLSDVKIVNGAGYNPAAQYALFVEDRPAITFGNTVYVRPDLYVEDMSVGRENIARLAHEFKHVLQFQTLGFSVVIGRISAENARYGQRDVYNYRGRNTTYHTETLEGQAQMVGDYARMRETGSWRNQTEIFRSLTQKLRGSGIYGL